jgi:UrcA family protein
MQTLKTRSIAAVATVAATFLTVAAATPLRAETVSVPVSVADLDLSTKAGSTMLDRRVAIAATSICGQADAMNRFRVAHCRAEVLKSAQSSIKSLRTTPVALAAR